METSAPTLIVPVFQYWHLNNLQSKEIERIQENNGVKIKTDVCVSFEEAGATNTQNLYLSDDNPDLPAVLPSAPPDLGSFYIRLHWPEVGLPQRWAPMLQKALQTWMNKTLLNEINVRCNIHRLQPLETPGCAEVQLTPFAALSKILTKKSSHLTFKDLKQTAVVDFYSSAAQMNKSTDAMKNGQTALQIPIKVNAVVDVQNFSPQVQAEVMKKFKTYSSGPHNLCIQGTLEDVNMFYDKLQQLWLPRPRLH
ncbi:uncharacterized protein LOC134463342 isoform X1 [Engraulis encrasicolus]|uniref:uncharacterized protein LOC134463342 isoform X1 n=1 Tax=Engraulis encrasicolus TaxID=184585 RepID=UPI002FD43C6D